MNSCTLPSKGNPTRSNTPLTARRPWWPRTSVHRICGRRSCTTHGKAPNPVSYSGTRFCANPYPTAMPISGFRTVSTNPCGEIPLCPYDSCRLLAINLYAYVVNPFTPEAYFDFDLFKKHVQLAQRLMDDIIDLELEKIEMILQK